MKNKLFRIFFFLINFLIFFSSVSQTQTKRALLIGINTYVPENITENTQRNWSNLDGPVNDVESIKAVILSKYGFESDNITTLLDAEATRENILSQLQNLSDISEEGDIIFIFYAGHGSQVFNSLSNEQDKKDESIIPSDSFNGVTDIRDKELAPIFNMMIDNGATVTVILDCCHSGSGARGNLSPDLPKIRKIETNPIDVADPSNPPKPEERGALIFSACQDYQVASEKNSNGVFTMALIKALNESSVTEPVDRIFLKVKANIQSNGSQQEPVIAGKNRMNKTIFGIDAGSISGKSIVAVTNISGNEVRLQGGIANGLDIGCELINFSTGNDTKNIRLKVKDVFGLSKCNAEVIEGNIDDVKTSDLFILDRWVSQSKPGLFVWMQPSEYSYQQLTKIALEFYKIKNEESIIWVDDPTEEEPSHIIYFDNEKWIIRDTTGYVIDIGKEPIIYDIVDKLKEGSKVFVNFPPPVELFTKIKSSYEQKNKVIKLVSSSVDADYILTGRLADCKVEYAWIRPNIGFESSDNNGTLPLRTRWKRPDRISLDSAADSLINFSLRLGKVKAWLTLDSPPGDDFPYSLAIKKVSSNELITQGTIFEGDVCGLVLTTDDNKLEKWNVSNRFIYVLAIDNSGNTIVLFPYNNVEHKLPIKNNDEKYPQEIRLGPEKLFSIGPPFGTDTYILLTTEEAIPLAMYLGADGVRAPEDDHSPFESLIYDICSGTRGAIRNIPVNWSIERITVTSMQKE
ncbi:MAG: caspase family protein [Ignavibacteria bacterium]|nr:caspase family protein [Ignavibacteria bacterium]